MDRKHVQEGVLLRIYVREDEKVQGTPLYEFLVRRALETGMAGATALRGMAGFGGGHHMHTAKILRLSSDLPIVIEIVDTKDKIDSYLIDVEPFIGKGLVAEEKVTMHYFREKKTE